MEEDSELYARSNARIGMTLGGKYHLDHILGMGGMAVVYSATHRNQKQFAVKVLHPELSMRADIRTRFLREGYAANSLKHPGAVAVLDDDVAADGSAFLVMELLEGQGVEQLWEKCGQRMPAQAVLALGYQLLDVLAAAHAKGIVHRDIKPPNLFLTHDGTLKVLDFGIARVRDVLAGGSQATGTGMLLGTPAFMAPEQALAQSNEIDGQTDIWATGATLFTLLSGQFVHLGDNGPQLMIKAATTPARSLTTVAPDTPLPAVYLIDCALAFEKVARWPTAEAMRDAIRDAYVATYGESMSRAPLIGLLYEHGQLAPSTQHMVTPAFPTGERSLREPLPSPTFPLSPSGRTVGLFQPSSTPAPSGLAGGSMRGGTLAAGGTPMITSTPKPVSTDASDASDAPAGLPGKRTQSAVMGAVAMGVVAILAFAAFELHERSSAGRAPAYSSATSAPAPPQSPAGSATAATTSSPSPSPSTAPTAIPTETAATAPPSSVAATHRAVRNASPAPSPPVSVGKPAPAAPCKWLTTLDKNSEPHFSCPCAKCTE